MATDLPNDTEAAIRYIKSLLPITVKDTYKYPPIVFITQIYDIIHNKTLINRELVSKNSIKYFFITNINHEIEFHRKYCKSSVRYKNLLLELLILLQLLYYMKIT